jgi:hypothetical protein
MRELGVRFLEINFLLATSLDLFVATNMGISKVLSHSTSSCGDLLFCGISA